LPRAGRVSVRLYDAAGRVAAEPLKRTQLSAGAHKFSLDARALTPGVYFVRQESPNKSLTQKVILTK
jgi:hypothetical protein